MLSNHSSAVLIPVLVTGIPLRRVCAVQDPFAPTDLGALDSCDKHRNEGHTVVAFHIGKEA
jgi:tRNA(Ile)-lysidine synthase